MNPTETEKTASQIHVEQHEAQLRRCAFAHDPDLLIETVARHYASLGRIAADLYHVMDSRKYLPIVESERAFIAHQLKAIEDRHKADFGVPASWAILRAELGDK